MIAYQTGGGGGRTADSTSGGLPVTTSTSVTGTSGTGGLPVTTSILVTRTGLNGTGDDNQDSGNVTSLDGGRTYDNATDQNTWTDQPNDDYMRNASSLRNSAGKHHLRIVDVDERLEGVDQCAELDLVSTGKNDLSPTSYRLEDSDVILHLEGRENFHRTSPLARLCFGRLQRKGRRAATFYQVRWRRVSPARQFRNL